MGKAKIAITLSEKTVGYLDRLVRERVYRSRSEAIQDAVDEKVDKLQRNRLAEECAKLDPREEQDLAEEGLGEDPSEWPEY